MRTIPQIGTFLSYRLSENDSCEINKSRTAAKSLNENEIELARAVILRTGNYVSVGDQVAMICTARDEEHGVINGTLFLDGADTFWVKRCLEGTGPGQWDWIS